MQILEIEIHKLKEYDKNTKEHPKEQVKKIANSIKEFGFNVPVIIDKNYTIVAGHGRIHAARLLGLEKVPVIMKDDLTEEQIRAYRIADNKTAESDWNIDFLKQEFQSLLQGGHDLSLTGFSDLEIKELMPSALSPDIAFGNIQEGDKPQFEQMTFILHKTQSLTVKLALKKAKEDELMQLQKGINANSNGNALFILGKRYIK